MSSSTMKAGSMILQCRSPRPDQKGYLAIICEDLFERVFRSP